jgi:hypothetical protein
MRLSNKKRSPNSHQRSVEPPGAYGIFKWKFYSKSIPKAFRNPERNKAKWLLSCR